MSVYKEANNTWCVKRRYQDWTGKTKYLTKRGFSRRRDAVEWEANFMARQDSGLDISFSQFYERYKEHMSERLKASTWETKASIIEAKILPYFGELRIRDITSVDVIRWQNEMMRLKTSKGKPYSQTYLRTLHNQLTAIFNHAVRFYKLAENPARNAGAMGESEGPEMQVWSKEEYLRFAEAVMDKPISYYCFELLYWTGIREGELLALTADDFNLKKGTLSISKTYHRSKGEDIITSPKTKQSVRTVSLPGFLVEEIKDYLSMYRYERGCRIFPVSKHYLTSELERGAAVAGVRRIRVHDIRHSHVSMLIQMGYSAVAIAKRVGHKSVDITYRYAHLFPSEQVQMIEDLDALRNEEGA